MRKPSTYAVVKTLVLLQATGAAGISFMHIVEVGYQFGLGWQSWLAPALIDGFAILGSIGRSARDPQDRTQHAFAERTRRAGFRLMVAAGLVSLVCNVAAGANIGQQVFGVLVVAGFVVGEWYAGTMDRAPAVVAAAVDEATRARRSAAAVKAAATRKRNAAAAAKSERASIRAAHKALDLSAATT
jgi:hypothetical protein